jgi:NADPH:quinone reductase-like Zn-dependent oxidoreductase
VVRKFSILKKFPAQVLEQITRVYESGKLRPSINSVFPIEKVREAHELSQRGHTRGKIVLTL